jgi:hypothetical protein
VSALFAGGITLNAEDNFSLTVKGNRFEIVNGNIKVDNLKGEIFPAVYLGGERSVFHCFFGKVKRPRLDSLMTAADEDTFKRIEMMSKPFDINGITHQFLVNIEARAGKPYIFIESALMNLGEIPSSAFFGWTWRMKSDKYSADGAPLIVAAHPWKKIPFKDCLFFPSPKSNMALALDGSLKNLEFFTNINSEEKTKSWKNAIWGLMINKKNPRLIKKDASIQLEFFVFSAKSASEAQAETVLLNKNKLLAR